jgi:methylated-DNA-[protein]-cysteine S-methyltransferase
MQSVSFDSPIGILTVQAAGGAIVRLHWGRRDGSAALPPVLMDARRQLAAYFAGRRQRFDLSLAPGGSPFQLAFHAALCAIPYGQTRTYGDLAKDLGVSPQAIGQACGANPIPILIPCHRVLAAHGLGGYSGEGGVEAKVALLRLEGAASLLI